LLNGVTATPLQGAIDNIWNNNVPKKITIARHCCCYTWIKEFWRRQMRRPHRSGAGHIAPSSQVAAGDQASHSASMIAKTSKTRKASASNPLASALARWESEGGAPGPASEEPSCHQPMPLSEGEKRMLQCLGAAALLQWNELPTPSSSNFSTTPLPWLRGADGAIEGADRAFSSHAQGRRARIAVRRRPLPAAAAKGDLGQNDVSHEMLR
jgi:hypothetical protein